MPIWLFWLIIAAAIAVMVGFAFIPAVMAKKKGYSYGGFWVFGFFLFIPAIIVAAVIGDKRGAVYPPNMQPGQYDQPYSQPGTCFCPNCGALMPNDSTFCPTCGARVG